jgi:Tol biopolymer transport system component
MSSLARAWRVAAILLLALGMAYAPAPASGANAAQGSIVLITSTAATLTTSGQSALWRATPLGAATKLLSRSGANGLSDATLSPDGRHIAFVEDGQALWQMDSDGTHVRRLYELSLATYSRLSGPRYSPDGRTITFTTGCCASFTVYSINSDGSYLRILLKGGGLRIFQDWSPNGVHILYTQNGALWVADGHAAHAHPLGGDAPAAGSFLLARYSPDGTHIVAAMHPAQGSEAAATQIVLMHADGQYLTPLTGNLAYDVGTPSWSPDGKQIAFVVSSGAESALGRNHDLWIMRFNGANKKNVTHGSLGDIVEAGWAR